MGIRDWMNRIIGTEAVASAQPAPAARQPVPPQQAYPAYSAAVDPQVTTAAIIEHATRSAFGDASLRTHTHKQPYGPHVYTIELENPLPHQLALRDRIASVFAERGRVHVPPEAGRQNNPILLKLSFEGTRGDFLNLLGNTLQAPSVHAGIIDAERVAKLDHRAARQPVHPTGVAPERTSAEHDLRGELTQLHREGVVRTQGRPDVPFSQVVTEAQLQSLLYRGEDGRIRISTERVHNMDIDSPHAKRQVVAGIANLALRNDVMDREPHVMLKRYGLEAHNNGNQMVVGMHRAPASAVDSDYQLFTSRYSSVSAASRDDRILGQSIGSGTRRITSQPLTDHRAPGSADVADTSGWNRFPAVEGPSAVFDRGNGRSNLAEMHRETMPRRTGGGWIAPAVAAVTAGGGALIAGNSAAEAATHAVTAAADATPMVGAMNAARQGRQVEATQRQFDDLTFGLHGEIARPLQRYFNGRGDTAPDTQRIDPSMGETLVRNLSGLGELGYRKLDSIIRGVNREVRVDQLIASAEPLQPIQGSYALAELVRMQNHTKPEAPVSAPEAPPATPHPPTRDSGNAR